MFIFVYYKETKIIEVFPEESIRTILNYFSLNKYIKKYNNDISDHNDDSDNNDDSDDGYHYHYHYHDIYPNKFKKNKIKIYYNGESLSFNESFNFYGIKQYDILKIYVYSYLKGGAIDNIKDEIDLNIGFDMN